MQRSNLIMLRPNVVPDLMGERHDRFLAAGTYLGPI
jgi:hypothetical protein